MNIFQLLLYRDLPSDFKSMYGNFIRSCKRLRNGWKAVKVSNGVVFMMHNSFNDFFLPCFDKIYEAKDGKFMIQNRAGDKVVYSARGMPCTHFDKHVQLYSNGWFQQMDDGVLCLYDDKGTCVASHLMYARVYKNGMYRLCMTSKGNKNLAGVFSAERQCLLQTNSFYVVVLNNGFFVTDKTLFSPSGEICRPELSHKLPTWLLVCIGFFMKI